MLFLIISLFVITSFRVSSASSSSIPYLSLAESLANLMRDHMYNQTAAAFYNSVSNDWGTITGDYYSTLGNGFILAGLIQLYLFTSNTTYLNWVESTASEFWSKGWDSVNDGFYDSYKSDWVNSTCTQTLQNNAIFEIVYLELYRITGSQTWLNYANSIESLLNSRFWSSSLNVPEVSYNVCKKSPSNDTQIEVAIGSYLWATGYWSSIESSTQYTSSMNQAANFAWNYLWDSSTNSLASGSGSIDCSGQPGYLGFMRSAYLSPSVYGEDCRKGANENIWGAMGLAVLYNLTKSQVLLGEIEQDMNWINETFWDKSYGGFHQDSYRNDSLRSACSSTGDIYDYPGWTEGEQPMFWWNIGNIIGNSTYITFSLNSEKWTAEHQWSQQYGGDLTCTEVSNGQIVVDPGSVDLYDWIQGSALYAYSTLYQSNSSGSCTSSCPLAIDNNGRANCTASLNGAGNLTCSFTTSSANDVILVFVSSTSGTADTPSASGITITQFFARNNILSSVGNAYEFFATTSTSGAVTITDRVNSNSKSSGSVMIAFAVSGADTSSPWDPNLKQAPTPSSGKSSNPSVSFSTTGTDDMLIGFVTSPNSTSFSAGAGSKMVNASSNLPISAAEYEVTSSPDSQIEQFSSTSSVSWIMFGDALVSPSGLPEFPVGLLPFLIIVPVIYFVITRLGKDNSYRRR